ncbi:MULTISPECIES: PH domain-containing protein [unclassified Saccharopolyspora]|uniref:PH domain-containing protein n=1 Tax=unclassified Saccharopolyspora TaxID=2646250 RepID=UPI001CD2E485|nr:MULTISPECIES: PH domain-containing protein [unclassified Saccharopolyspora]MCA1186848.1 PH domain-containing protein [Saccharopolyspora sp. 6T]MCA1190936.1 PH domain-containing protein [Saccharopolyspora sp. 6V]MCA1278737.1 PH domain-containing protein [Saccharopolyspora sp. 7B]
MSTSEDQGTTGTATREDAAEPGVAPATEATGPDAPEGSGAAGQPRTAEGSSTGDSGTDDFGIGSSGTAEPAGPAATPVPRAAGRAKALPKSLTFQLTRTSLLAVFAVTISVTPIAFAEPFPQLLPTYLIPLALAYVIVRPRTVVTAERITVRRLFGRTGFGWDELASLRLDERRWVRAVLGSGAEIALPAIRVRDVGRLAELSGGRVPDPNAAPSAPEPDGATAEARDAADEGTGSATDAESAATAGDAASGSPTTAGTEATGAESAAEPSTDEPGADGTSRESAG